ncbi:MAG: phenylalanine--tRNA ligase subunit beta [Chloroflexi bacterium HGW-Chloroflexi-6]|nr:MAG: phenylalanine--tRNA ligase subunit beta [Chloroflexi bacterium HGW-Chloroflexi-6]
MRLPISWINEFVDLSGLEVIEIARLLTLAGLEIDDIRFAGLSLPTSDDHGFKVNGIAWDKEKIVVAEIREVGSHPNADRLTLCELFDGEIVHTVLTGAPNLYPFKGLGKLEKPIKVAYAKEGATIYDGHAEGLALTTLKRAKIRGVESYSMVCSEKELGISEEHEGVIFLDDDAVAGTPLIDYMGDAVLEISILPNNARNTSVLGIARELAALTGRTLKKPNYEIQASGEPVEGKVKIEIANPELNPRFTLGLIRNVEIKPSPYWVQKRLRLCGMRPISNIVDATNYTMLELGEPLHAFDYDVLAARAGGKPVIISTRVAKPGEKLTTLDNVERALSETNVLVCDSAGALSLAGVMGGQESEISDKTVNILLEAAAWNFINIRKTANQHNLPSEASYRFSRGVHPGLALEGLKRCLYWMAQWSGGQVAPGIVDEYPLPPHDPTVEIRESDIRRALGIEIPLAEVKALLERLEFTCKFASDDCLLVTAPPIRMDIGEGVVGLADVMEEVARLYGFDRIPETRMADPLPPQRGNPALEAEEHIRDTMVALGLQEIITHRMTAPEIESRLLPPGSESSIEYVKLANAIAPEKRVLRRSLLSSVLNVVERNARLRESLAMFELGSVYIPNGKGLPLEPRRLAFAITGRRYESAWDTKLGVKLDFYDLKGVIEALMDALHLDVSYVPAEHPSFHPGKCAAVVLGASTPSTSPKTSLGVFGELHPQVQENFDFVSPVLAADFDLDAMLAAVPAGYPIRPVSEFPPVLEDIAVIVDEALPADKVEALIRQTGGKMLESVHLFDVFRSEQIGEGKKSLAYAMTYRSSEGTLTDKDATGIRTRIIKRLENELGAKLRS